MRYLLIPSAAVILFIAGCSPPQPRPFVVAVTETVEVAALSDVTVENMERSFRRLDTNGDNFLVVAEACETIGDFDDADHANVLRIRFSWGTGEEFAQAHHETREMTNDELCEAWARASADRSDDRNGG